MTIQWINFEVKPQEKRRTQTGMIDANGTEGKFIYKNLSVPTQYRS
jgi:hypothetical protein